jgi:hypothetical protein
MQKATREEIEEFLKRFGKQGEATLSTLGKLHPFVACMESDIGGEILQGFRDRYELLLNKSVEMEATELERLELKMTKKFLLEFSSKIQMYNNRIEKIKVLGAKDKPART